MSSRRMVRGERKFRYGRMKLYSVFVVSYVVYWKDQRVGEVEVEEVNGLDYEGFCMLYLVFIFVFRFVVLSGY